MSSQYEPQVPTAAFGRRYSGRFRYAFVMLEKDETVADFDVAGSLSDRFVELILPQQISLTEPYATSVTVMQDGGKLVESKGHVMKIGSVSGTTGFTPTPLQLTNKPSARQSVAFSGDVDGQLGAISGFLAFHKLRYLFRLYGARRRAGSLTATLHWLDYKNDDFWRIEPDAFAMHRSSRKPMSYDYDISFKCLEPSESRTQIAVKDKPIEKFIASITSGGGGIVDKFTNDPAMSLASAFRDSANRLSDLSSGATAFVNSCDFATRLALQAALQQVDAVAGFFENVHDTVFERMQTVVALLAMVNNSLAGVMRTASKFAPDNIFQELNSWYLEVQFQVDMMAASAWRLTGSPIASAIKDVNAVFSTGRAKKGFTTDFMPSVGPGSPDANPFLGRSGLQLITDVGQLASAQLGSDHVQVGEDVYSLAQRLLGDAQRWIDLVIVNRLEFPFIVASTSAKPSNTLAWGEVVLYPLGDTPRQQDSAVSQADAPDDGAFPTTSGTVTVTSPSNQLIDGSAAWNIDQWVGYTVTATTNGVSQSLVVVNNSATGLVLSGTWTITITPYVTTYAIVMNIWSPRRPTTPETKAYGTDLLLVQEQAGGLMDIALNVQGDAATVTGNENLFQAIMLRSRCPIGRHPVHRTYGLSAPIGRPYTAAVGALHSFFIRRSLLEDARIAQVRNVQLALAGDTLTMSAEVRPINARRSLPVVTQVGS